MRLPALRILLAVGLLAGKAGAEDSAASVEESAPIADLFARAREGAERADWKLVVDSLQRIINDPGGSLIKLDNRLYESARLQALRRLAALPESGLEAYHLLYDGEARHLYEAALAEHDVAGMKRVCQRYLLTGCGGEAAITLAGWMLDAGKASAAVTSLNALADLMPSSPLNRTAVPAMLAVAEAQLRRPDQAKVRLEALHRRDDLSPEWQARLRSIATFVDGVATRGQALPVSRGWPLAYGDPGRSGQMPATQPALLEGLPWRYELPLQSPPQWSEVLDRQAQTGLILTSQLVADGVNLLVESDKKIVAIDLVSFDVNWISETPRYLYEPPAGTARGTMRSRQFPWRRSTTENSAAQDVDAALRDVIGAQLSVAHGLIFDLVQQPGGRSALPFGLAMLQGRAQFPDDLPNRLIARHLSQQGEIAWSVGAERRPGHPLDEVLFGSTPLEVGDRLLVTYWKDHDLYAALLDPAGGDVVREAYLCTVAEDRGRESVLVLPAADDQFAYIPTNSGLLVALNLGDFSLRWASGYERRASKPQVEGLPLALPETRQLSSGWLPGPPVVAGTTVLLAPPDSDALHAFEQSTGRSLWSWTRLNCSYIIAADHSSVWLGGSSLAQVALASGELLWRSSTPGATGRAVLSGEHIFLPTRQALLSVAASSGDLVDTQTLPSDHAPLGNLLCWGGALYSIDAQQVRKFPDLEKSYAPTRRMHLADPRDPAAAIRLAWMELFKQQPQKALEVLAQVEVSDSAAGRRQARQVAHLQVQALLASVRIENLGAVEAERRLRQACEIAATPADSFESVLALADQLLRNRDLVEAYHRLWRAAHSPEMDFLVNRSPTWKRVARAVLLEKLSEMRGGLTDSQQRTLADAVRGETALDVVPTRQTRREVWRRLDLLADGDALEDWNQAAALRLGRLAAERRQYEKAEYYLRRAVDLDLGRAATAAALLQLAEMYLRDDLAAVGLAAPVVRRLQEEFSETVIDGQSAGDLAAGLANRLESQRYGSSERFGLDSAESTSELAATPLSPGMWLHSGDDDAAPPSDLVTAFSFPNELTARRPSDGQLLWKTQLRLLSERTGEFDAVASPPAINRDLRRLQGRREGQTLLLNTQTGLHAVGLITGRRLWSVAVDVPDPSDGHVADAALFDVRDGRVAVRTGDHQVDLRRSVDGRATWRVQIPDYAIRSVTLLRDRLVAIDRSGLAAVVLDARTGRRIFDVNFAAPEQALGSYILIFDELICGTDGDTLVAYRLQDGTRSWKQPIGFTAVSLFKTSADCVALGGEQGRILVVQAHSGNALCRKSLPFAPAGILDGVLEDGALYLIGIGQQPAGQQLQLAALDLERRQVSWVNKQLGTGICRRAALGILRDSIPVVLPLAQHRRLPFDRRDARFLLGLVSKETGKIEGRAVPLRLEGEDVQLTGEIGFWPNRVVLGTAEGLIRAPWPSVGAERL